MAGMRTTVILKTDIVDSTPRSAQLSQSEMALQKRQHKRFISEITTKNDGIILQEEGDAFWIQLPSVTTAVLAAIEMHQSLRTLQAGRGEKVRLSIRAIITVGDVLYEGQDTMGIVFSQTARIEKITPPDEIYLSQAAWMVLNKGEIQTSFVNEFKLKGFPEPEKVYRVDQKFRSRVLTDQYIVFTDAKGFTPFIKSTGPETVESFLLACDDLINDACEKYNGVVRQVSGDQYFLTFPSAATVLPAIQEICTSWKRIVEEYGVGLLIGVHKGDLKVIRSFVYGDDIHTTIYLTEFNRYFDLQPSNISVVASRKIIEEFEGFIQDTQYRELDGSRLTEEKYRSVFQQEGAYQLLFG